MVFDDLVIEDCRVFALSRLVIDGSIYNMLCDRMGMAFAFAVRGWARTLSLACGPGTLVAFRPYSWDCFHVTRVLIVPASHARNIAL